MRASVVLVVLLGLTLPASLEAQERTAGPFEQGRIRGSLSAGTTFGGDDTYWVIGGGIGVFVIDGLEIGLDVESWLGADPTITKLSPQARYIFFMVPVVSPYLGAFYRHWFVSDQDDLNTLGGRLGIALVNSPHIFVGGGVVHEVVLSCEDDCSETYPEFFLGVSF